MMKLANLIYIRQKDKLLQGRYIILDKKNFNPAPLAFVALGGIAVLYVSGMQLEPLTSNFVSALIGFIVCALVRKKK